jgi:hypothetical protein
MKATGKKKLATSLALVLIAGVHAGEPAAPCSGVTDIKSKSRQTFEMKVLMPQLMMLEAQGEAKFHPTFAPPASQCSFEKFDVAGTSVEALYSPWEKTGNPALHWQFNAAGAEPRSIYVIYDATTSVMVNKQVFFVVEELQGKIRHYAIFREQPTFAALKPLVVGILDGSANPLSVVYWPAGAKEPSIDGLDKRMK